MAKSLVGLVGGLLVATSATLAAAQGPAVLEMPNPAPSRPAGTYYPLHGSPGLAGPVTAVAAMPTMGPTQHTPSAAGGMMMPSMFQPPAAGVAPSVAAPTTLAPTAMPSYGVDGGCAPGCAEACCDPGCPWYGGIAALFLERSQTNTLHFSYESTTPGVCGLRADDPALFDDTWGGEIWIGRQIGACGNGAIEGIYWTLDPMYERLEVTMPGLFLNTAIGLTNPTGPDLEIDGNTLDFWFNNAQTHVLERRNEIHNVEANGLFWAAPINADRRFAIAFLGGFRYFRFDENLLFGSLRSGNWGDNGGVDECYMDFDVTNSLIGGQLGSRAQFALTQRIALFASPKVGIFGNSIERRTQIYRGDGLSCLDISSTDGSAAVLGQLDAGVNVAITRLVSGFVGYRLIGISGIAQADNQVPRNVHLIEDIVRVNSSGDLFLNGAFAGLMFNY